MNLVEIHDLVFFNLSYCISIKDTLTSINRLDLLEYFIEEEKFIKQCLYE